MLKKLILTAVVAAAAVAALRGTRAIHYAKSEAASIQEWADDQIPVEKKIAQMRKDVSGLDRDVDRVKDELAKEIVEVRELTGDVARYRAQVEGEAKLLAATGAKIKDATEKVSVGKSMVPVAEAKENLQRDVRLHLKHKTQLDNMEKTLASRERIKETLEKQLDGMVKQKQELRVEIDAIEAEYKTVQLRQIESRYQRDDSRLSKVKETLRDLRKKMDVERERLNLAPKGAEDAPVAVTQSVDDILAPLSGKPAKAPEMGKISD